MRKLRHLDLFSGIGGFSLAARWTGAIETVTFCEIDPFCQKVLNKNFPGVPIISDIREVTSERIREIIADTTGVRCEGDRCMDTGERMGQEQDRPYPSESHFTGIDILTGGFPCQPFSCAGKRKGTEDNRFLWPEMLRVIREVEPTWVIAENVRGLLSIDNGLVFEQCCSEMEALGYEVQPFVIPACAVNAPHRRDRVWIVAHSKSIRSERRPCQVREEDGRRVGRMHSEFDGADRHAPDPDLQGSQGRDEYGERAGEWSFGPGHTEQWAEDWYTVALRTCVRGIHDGVSRRVDRVNRLKALGNAIVPQVAYEILKAIVEIEGGN